MTRKVWVDDERPHQREAREAKERAEEAARLQAIEIEKLQKRAEENAKRERARIERETQERAERIRQNSPLVASLREAMEEAALMGGTFSPALLPQRMAEVYSVPDITIATRALRRNQGAPGDMFWEATAAMRENYESKSVTAILVKSVSLFPASGPLAEGGSVQDCLVRAVFPYAMKGETMTGDMRDDGHRVNRALHPLPAEVGIRMPLTGVTLLPVEFTMDLVGNLPVELGGAIGAVALVNGPRWKGYGADDLACSLKGMVSIANGVNNAVAEWTNPKTGRPITSISFARNHGLLSGTHYNLARL